MKLQIFALAAAVFAGFASPASAGSTTIKIIGLNDFHGTLNSPGNFNGSPAGGADYLAGYVANLKAQNPRNVVVSAGDLIGASPLVSALFHDEGTIEAMNRIGLEFNAVGNHEFDEGKDELRRMQNGGCHPTDPNSCKGASVGTPFPFEGAKFKFLAANVIEELNSDSFRNLFAPYGIKSFKAASGRTVRVGFIGMTLKETPTIVTPTGVAGLSFNDEADSANGWVQTLRARGVEAIVVLIHQGGSQRGTGSSDINNCAGGLSGDPIRNIVSRLDDNVDLVISGHTHQAYNCSLQATQDTRLPTLSPTHKVPVTSANAFGRLVTDIDMTLDDITGDVIGVSAVNRVVNRSNAAITPNATIASIVNNYNSLVSPIANQVIGSITTDLPNSSDTSTAGKACNVPAGDLIADAQLAATAPTDFGGAEIAFMNRGGVRNPGFLFNQSSGGEAAGDVTYGEAFTVQPFGNSLVTLTLTAQQIKNVLEEQFAGCRGQTATTTRIMIPSAGFKYSWDGSKTCDSRISNVTLTKNGVTETLVDATGVVLDPTQTYRVTVNNFMATGGDGFLTFTGGTEALGGAQDIDALVNYMSANYKFPSLPYAPGAVADDLGTPRINRIGGGTTCPTAANTNP